ncbi:MULTISPECIES: helix-turn-helix domain-containing protein [Eubacteriales]|uniref:Helix-turn-helix transcriptional regulator n=1 Tax=Flintibacter hominis TaxID=2763048 RepID=A0A8J6JCH2_9FIRM|nr:MULTISPECIES: helix-turn-helix transcriptional regulator [Eubacteriales]MBC5723603.1 helix-turn-helix transcriptional regulator [Flintibacter hominis]MCU6701944.1 helix-turn-helix transcriptional regulator [Muriventricola aceti]SCI80627.1 Antitoxin HipB [uncultured Flavonifractor sp.]
MKLDIKRIRKEKGISQEELAEKSGVSRPTISNLENNPDAVTTTDTLQKIALALDVKVSDFLSP